MRRGLVSGILGIARGWIESGYQEPIDRVVAAAAYLCRSPILIDKARCHNREWANEYRPARFRRPRRFLTPEAVAEAVVRGVEGGGDVVLVGAATHLIYNLRRFSLSLTRRVNYEGAKAAGFR